MGIWIEWQKFHDFIYPFHSDFYSDISVKIITFPIHFINHLSERQATKKSLFSLISPQKAKSVPFKRPTMPNALFFCLYMLG